MAILGLPAGVLSAFVLYRFLSTFLVNTYFVPDEYWQSLEVAHKSVFGYGYLTWEWKEAIRSYFYPAWISLIYRLLKAFGMDNVYTLTMVPRMLQAILYGVGDYFVYKLASSLFGPRAASWTAFCLVTAWFPFYCASRTLTNTAEAALSSCVYYLYPWKKRSLKRRVWSYLLVMGVACLVRPTSGVLWAPLCAWHLCRLKFEDSLKQALRIFTVGIAFCISQCLVDYCGYGYWVFTPLRFLKFNWFQDIGAFYGTHSPYWYVLIGFPVVMTTNIAPFCLGVRIPLLRPFMDLIVWGIIILSFLQHKEFRFLLPLLPLALCVSGASIDASLRDVKSLRHRKLCVKLCLVVVTLVVNLPLIFYMSVYHQRGTLDVMKFIEQESRVVKSMSVMFLMPCHSTPFYSFIHRNIPMDFLTCEPNLKNVFNYKDEADIFYEDPTTWLSNALNQSSGSAVHRRALPSTHLVMFDSLYPPLADVLAKQAYELCFETFHTDFPGDHRVGHYVQVHCSKS